MVTRKHPELWTKAKAQVMTDGKRWDARKAQRAVQLYKSLGGEYIGQKPTAKNNSLVKWTTEDWQYVNPQSNQGRYLPKKVIDQMPKKLKEKEDKIKKKDKTANAPYSNELKAIMKKILR